MSYSVVTIARELGARGEDVGRTVAERLGFRYADDEILAAAAQRAGVSKEAIERAEHRPSLIGRILETMAGLPVEPNVYYAQALAAPRPAVMSGYDELIRDVIVQTASAGKVVIVAHGAGICLANTDGVLRALISATPEVRAERLSAEGGVDLDKARKAIESSDADRQDFLKRFYDVRHEEPWHYDLVINTSRLSVEQAADVIVSQAR